MGLNLLISLVVISLVAMMAESFAVASFHPRSLRVRGSGTCRGQLEMRWGLKGGPNLQSPSSEDDTKLRDTVPFELRGFSLPLVVFSVGLLLTSFSFAGFFLNDGGGDGALSSLGFVYGIPVFLIGLSLWYAEIPPVLVESDAAGDEAWESMSTKTMLEIKQDVTRHRYGDDAHLDSTLEALGLKLPQKKYPKFQTITQKMTSEGELEFGMIFQSAETPYKVWADPDRVKRYDTFFGPGVVSRVEKVDAEKRLVGLILTTTSKSEDIVPASESVDDAPTNSE
jgi:hypothetical protein